MYTSGHNVHFLHTRPSGENPEAYVAAEFLTIEDDVIVVSHEKTHEIIVSLEEFMHYDDMMTYKKAQGMRGMPRGRRSKNVIGAAFYGMVRCSVCSRKLTSDPIKWLMRYR